MTDLSKINTIQEAKSAQYNGTVLTRDEEKKIFDDSRLKDSSDNTKIDVSKLRDAAKLLDEVKKAQAKTQWNPTTDQTILDKLKKEKTDDTLASKVVNTAKTVDGTHLLDSVITHLEAIRDGHKAEAEEAESRIQAIQQEIDDYTAVVSQEHDVLGKQLLTSIVDRNKAYLVYPNGLYDYGNIVETSVGYDGRNYLTAEQISLMDETKLFALINSDAYFASGGRSRANAKAAYDRLKDGPEYGEENQLVFNDPNSYVNKPLDQRKPEEIKWPFAKAELRDIAIFMKNVFPRDALDTNPILSSTDDTLRGKEVVEVSWFGLRSIPKTDTFISASTLKEFVSTGEMSASKKMAQIGKANAFKDDSLLDDDSTSPMMRVLKFDPDTSTTALQTVQKTRTKLEVDKKNLMINEEKLLSKWRILLILQLLLLEQKKLKIWDEKQERKAKLMSEADSKNFADIQNRLRRAQAEKLEVQRKEKVAQDWIDKFAGMDLQGLKKAFKDIYKTGPSASNKYSPEDIETMFSLLVDIKNKEVTKQLDSEFAGYESTIEEKMAKRNFATDEVKDRELRRIKAAFEGIENLRKLGALEDEDFKSIKEVLDGTRQIPDKKKPSDLNPTNLTNLFVKEIITDNYAPSKGKHDELLSHLTERGDVDKDTGYKISSPSEKAAKKYGDPTEGNEDKMERDKLIAFLYDEKLKKFGLASKTTWEQIDTAEEEGTTAQDKEGEEGENEESEE
ncbi:14267_t:CDS:10 [Cetraspora pellucida]|uniref:14267_t:CDS:1 n=1 Tax=Cetraspora pellucida TaxID=1433469 RepID=A0ACA9KG42_9GLOM|nr:14267_t:CDS:10 [Cetraspora pellucida]